ncbi:MAG TPA: M50 family metallopeptidase [Acidobacteriaceae bacterium]|nr:M50 family metallopeptidase [Acidobacteriaceae bacterium]
MDRLLKLAHLLAIVFAIYACYLAIIAVHEAGHLVAAKLCGFPLKELRIGPLQWLKEPNWKFAIRKDSFFGGIVRAPPTKGRNSLRLRLLIYGLGGPAANIVFSVCGWCLGRAIPENRVAGLIALCSAGSLLIGLINLIPAHVEPYSTDGQKIIDAFSKKFREVRFAVCYLDSKDELKSALRAKDFELLKRIGQELASLADGIPEDNKAVIAVRRVLEISDRGIGLSAAEADVPIEDLSR